MTMSRLRQIYHGGAHATVKNAVHGEANVGGLRSLGREAAADDAQDLPETEGERANLRGEELKQAIAAEKAREQEIALNDKTALNDLYDPGTWRCSRCHSALGPKVTECPNFVRVPGSHGKQAKYGNAVFQYCRGSQIETLGGTARLW